MNFFRLLLITLALTASVCHAAIIETELTFNADNSSLSQGDTVLLTADFGGSFAYIDTLTFNFNFENDLFNPNEQFYIGPFRVNSTSTESYGRRNIFSVSYNASSISLIPGHAGIGYFLDGVESFLFESRVGSMNLISASIVANGGFEPSPVPVPAAIWLFGSGLIGLGALIRIKKS